ncbi:hypothetical protein CRM22_002581 [Opisthorchis felineus]|uniref:dolichyl-phosphate-mannose--protein mannosyltransferase n=1 Tax=Opisthorchis felineus TaxID=147828 RepID=A0A4S2M5D0_OPIFE|nr:hypothetical protein CRM22_002581 [Opisthorchis felineus]
MMVHWEASFLALVTFVVYWNALFCGFVFDDASAIKDNPDLRPSTNWTDLFFNDFWGTPMKEERSHKSYRPVTVLTFRFNYLLHQLDPVGYHAVNVALHSTVCIAFYRLCTKFLEPDAALVSSLYFAVHPVHTEAVTGVVGRAELLSALITLVILMYYECVRSSSGIFHWVSVLLIGLLLALGTLCKEQCITTVGILLAYEFTLAYQSFLDRLRKKSATNSSSAALATASWPIPRFSYIKRVMVSDYETIRALIPSRPVQRLIVLLLCAACMMLFRIRIMGSQLPHFTEFDNPAAHASPLIRRLTHLYLIPVNLWLLVYPSDLCADWTLGSLRLIDGWTDPRNLSTIVAFGLLFITALLVFDPRTGMKRSRVLALALSLLVLPFLPASNLFFYVGFVVAERVLYTPSLGFCLLLGLGYQVASSGQFGIPQTHRTNRWHKFRLRVLVTMVIIAFSVKTIRRNSDWTDEYNLFSSALKVNPRNAKMWNNVGHALEARGEFRQALGYFQKAVEVQPNDIGARINVGRTYVNLQMPKEAEIAYFGALDYFPKPKKGQTYYARVAPKDLMVFINLANLYLNKTPPLLEDAARLLRRAISLRSDFVDAYQNYGSVLIKQGKADEAETVYRSALTYQERNPDLNYNLGVVLLESGRRTEGLFYLNNALKYKPEHLPTMFAMASTLTETTDPVERERGKHLLENLAERRYEFAKVHFALGMLETDLKNFKKAASHYYKTIEAEPNHRSALFNLALLSRNQLNDYGSAIPLLERIIQVYPDHVKSYLLLGDIELTERKKPEVALKLFRRALELAPTNVQAKHNLCIALAEQDDLEASEECLLQAIQMAPHEAYLREHLAVVRRRLDPE